MLPYASIEAACGSVSFPRFAGEGRDGGQRADEVVYPPPRSSQVRGRLSPTSILPHTWGRKMLQNASIESAFDSVSFHRFAGEGRDGGQRADEVVCPPPQSSPIHGGGRCCHMRVLKLHVAASPSPASRGKAGMGASAQRNNPNSAQRSNPSSAATLALHSELTSGYSV